MKKWLGIVLATALGATIFAAGNAAPPAAGKTTGRKAASAGGTAVERGKYLVEILACGDCHTPKKMGPDGPEDDASRLLAGHTGEAPAAPAGDGIWIAHTTGQMTAWAGPWGISFTKNLTPDENTGIGSWSEETFVKALRTGRHMGVSRPILPPMPWQAYAKMTDEDLKAVYAYLRTIPPIHNPTPDPVAPAGARP